MRNANRLCRTAGPDRLLGLGIIEKYPLQLEGRLTGVKDCGVDIENMSPQEDEVGWLGICYPIFRIIAKHFMKQQGVLPSLYNAQSQIPYRDMS